jgi:hypothetical protein
LLQDNGNPPAKILAKAMVIIVRIMPGSSASVRTPKSVNSMLKWFWQNPVRAQTLSPYSYLNCILMLTTYNPNDPEKPWSLAQVLAALISHAMQCMSAANAVEPWIDCTLQVVHVVDTST